MLVQRFEPQGRRFTKFPSLLLLFGALYGKQKFNTEVETLHIMETDNNNNYKEFIFRKSNSKTGLI